MLRLTTVLVLLVASHASGPLTAQDSKGGQNPRPVVGRPEAFFEKAWRTETAEGDPDGAYVMYREIAESDDVSDDLRAKSLYRAAHCLRKIGRTADARSALEKILTDFPSVQDVTREAKRDLETETKEEAAFRQRVAEALAKFDEGCRYLESTTRGQPAPEQWTVATRQLRALEPRAASQILEHARNTSDRCRYALAGAVVDDLELDASVEAVIRQVIESDNPVRVSLVESLGGRRPSWRPLFRTLFDDPDPRMRATVAKNERHSDDAANRELLIQLLDDDDADVRRAATYGLESHLANPSELKAIRDHYGDTSPDVRETLLRVTERIWLNDSDALSKEHLDMELALLGDDNAEVRTASLEFVGEQLHHRGGELSRIASSNVDLDRLARRALACLKEFLDDDSAVDALDLLDAAGGAHSLEAIATGLHSARPPIVERAIAMAKRANDPAVVDIVLDFVAGEESLDKRNATLTREAPHTKTLRSRRSSTAGRRANARETLARSTRSKLWNLLFAELWNAQTLEKIVERLPDLGDSSDHVLKKVASLGRRDLAHRIFSRFRELPSEIRVATLLKFFPQFHDVAGGYRAALDGLNDANEGVRVTAIGIIDRHFLQNSESIEALVRAFHATKLPGHQLIQRHVLRSFGRVDDPTIFPVIETAIRARGGSLASSLVGKRNDSPWMVAVRGGEWPEAPVVPVLLDVLKDPAYLHAELATTILDKIARRENSTAMAGALPDILEVSRPSVIRTLGRLAVPTADPTAFEAVVSAYRSSSDAEVQTAAVEASVHWGPKLAYPFLKDALENPRESVRSAAACALFALPDDLLKRDEAMVDRLARVLTDRPSRSNLGTSGAECAVGTLALLGTPTAVSRLLAALDGEESKIREFSARALGTVSDPRVVPALIAQLDDLPAAVNALAAQADPSALPALVERVLDGTDPSNTIFSLRHYPAKHAVPALEGLIEEDIEDQWKTRAIGTLAHIRAPESTEALSTLLTHPESRLRRSAVEAVESLVDPGFLPKLVELLRDPDVRIQSKAREAIDRIRFYEEQKRQLDTPQAEFDALSALLELTAHDEASVRLAAVNSLARLEGERVLQALVRMRKDPDADVRKAVDRALDEVAGRSGDG